MSDTNDHASNVNIVLAGFMGAGKTTVGGIVAERLGREFIDTDAHITEQTGVSITQIFAERGEATFRQLEAEVAQSLAARDNLVIATGGGMFLNVSNRHLLESSGLVICLKAAPDVIAERIAAEGDERPLAGDWGALYESRRPVYDAIEHQIDTDDKTPEAVAAEVIALWRSYT